MKPISFLVLLIVQFSCFAQRGYVRGAIEKKYEKEQGPEGEGALNKWMYGNLMNVKVEPKYTFTITMLMQVKD
jgi:hypothetical protein